MAGDNTIILTLAIIALVVLLGAVVTAALKHAVVRQLESKVDELKKVLEENTRNIAGKAQRIKELETTREELKNSLQSLSERNTGLSQEHRELKGKYEQVKSSFEEAQQNYLNALQSIADTKRELDEEMDQLRQECDSRVRTIRQDALEEKERFKESLGSEFEHLKKSHKRLVQANATLSRNIDNLRDERDFYRTEFETLRDFLHESQIKNVKQTLEQKEEELKEKIVNFENKKS